MKRSPVVLAVGGLEPTGRAGLLADVDALRALGARPVAVASSLTAQGRTTYLARPVAARLLERQLEAALELCRPRVVKLGVVPDRARLGVLRDALAPLRPWWVVDPVVRTSKGERLSRLTREDFLSLRGPRVVLTPNVDEAAWLLGIGPLRTLEFIQAAARALVRLGFGTVVVKGGHLEGAPRDVFATGSRLVVLSHGDRVPRTPRVRGSGCRFASAIAAHLAVGATPLQSARDAGRFVRSYVTGSIMPPAS